MVYCHFSTALTLIVPSSKQGVCAEDQEQQWTFNIHTFEDTSMIKMLMMFYSSTFFNVAQYLSCEKLESEGKLEIDGLTQMNHIN